MSESMLPFPIAQSSTKSANSAHLGKRFTVGGREYRMVYNAATLTAPKQKVITYTIASNAVVWSAVVVATGTGATQYVGVCALTATGNLTAGSYFYVCREGDVTCKSTATITAGGMIGPAATAGSVIAIANAVSAAGVLAARKRIGRTLAARVTTTSLVLVRLEGII
jgi:hypothetical protein